MPYVCQIGYHKDGVETVGLIGTGTIWKYDALQRKGTILTAWHVIVEALERGEVNLDRGWLVLYFLNHPEPSARRIMLDAPGRITFEKVSGYTKKEKDGNLTAPRSSKHDRAQQLDCGMLHFMLPSEAEWDVFTSQIANPIPRGSILEEDNPNKNPAKLRFVNIIQHVAEKPKTISLRGRLVDLSQECAYYRYDSDTRGGCSGAPVFNDDWQWIGIHQGGLEYDCAASRRH